MKREGWVSVTNGLNDFQRDLVTAMPKYASIAVSELMLPASVFCLSPEDQKTYHQHWGLLEQIKEKQGINLANRPSTIRRKSFLSALEVERLQENRRAAGLEPLVHTDQDDG